MAPYPSDPFMLSLSKHTCATRWHTLRQAQGEELGSGKR